jgi:hypothetical protein
VKDEAKKEEESDDYERFFIKEEDESELRIPQKVPSS